MPWLTSLACVLFVVVFVGMLLWTFRKGSTKLYEECGHIPLEDGAEKRGNS
ncbi:cbb3-type cytochrome c oxidase subunit 3 [bacterium]|nr:cbb3-type cytochrome c oxidase subunit 3 [bacterium]